ncbi:Zinc finger CCHC domain-containing protein 3 [Anabarilius grahami]|uniref:Zinc finger CCHC domain-containing protein 3 n=1 Tax=Anabarilius grahami TaxID=495550 RepID=A0A3N0XN44_ANAGA|nr:Zinc finger CCHC domain-containing protein 3 [Anabarilius grahami]
MSGNDEREAAMMVRLRNTIRVLLKKDAEDFVKQRFGRDFFVTEILRGLFEIQPAEVFCLQDFVSTGFLDLTFCVLKDCVGFFEAWKKREGHKLLEGLQLQPVFVQDFIPLTIRIYYPFVEDGDVMAFIARYCDVVRGGERLRDLYGIWNGKRRYMVKLRLDSSSPGTVLHPPGSFSIGPNRGFLHYPGQPLYCRRCGGQGHIELTAATEGANKDQGAEESAVHHQDKGPAVVEVNQPRPSGAAQEREQSQGIGQTWSDIDIAEVFSGAAIVSSNNTIQDTPQAEDPARFTWSQLDALDIDI